MPYCQDDHPDTHLLVGINQLGYDEIVELGNVDDMKDVYSKQFITEVRKLGNDGEEVETKSSFRSRHPSILACEC